MDGEQESLLEEAEAEAEAAPSATEALAKAVGQQDTKLFFE